MLTICWLARIILDCKFLGSQRSLDIKAREARFNVTTPLTKLIMKDFILFSSRTLSELSTIQTMIIEGPKVSIKEKPWVRFSEYINPNKWIILRASRISKNGHSLTLRLFFARRKSQVITSNTISFPCQLATSNGTAKVNRVNAILKIEDTFIMNEQIKVLINAESNSHTNIRLLVKTNWISESYICNNFRS